VLDLNRTERDELARLLGPTRATRVLKLATRAPSGELTGPPDPKVHGSGRYFTEVTDPRDDRLKRLDPHILERVALDPQIGLALDMIKLPVLTITPEVRHPEPTVREFLQYELDFIWPTLAREMLHSLDFGFSAFERVYGSRDTTIKRDGTLIWSGRATVFEKLKNLHPSGVELLLDERGQYAGLKETAGNSVTLPIEKTLLFTHDRRFGNPYGNPRTRRAYKFWWWGELIYQFANRYFEDQSIPQRKVFYEPNPQPVDPDDPDGAQQDEAGEAAIRIAEESRSGAAVALPLQQTYGPDGSSRFERSWDMEFMTGDSKQAEFTAYLDHLDFKKTRAMFIPDKLANQASGGGSYNMVEVLADMFLLSEEALIGDMLANLVHQWARPLIDFNFGRDLPDASFAPAKLTKANRDFLQAFMLQFYSVLMQTGARAPDVDIEALASELGVPIIATPDDGVTDQDGDGQDAQPAAAEPTRDAPARFTTAHVHTSACQHEPMTLARAPGARKRRSNARWEVGTAEFEEWVARAYDLWARDAMRAVLETEAPLRSISLTAKLAELERTLKREYRKALNEAFRLGGGDAPSAAALVRQSERLAGFERHLSADVIPRLRDRLTPDLNLPAEELEQAMRLRMGIVTGEASHDYWATIQESWTDNRAEREELAKSDPSVRVGRVRWVLDPTVKEHCADCPSFAGVYAGVSDLPAVPGDGTTECDIYCRCWLEEEDPETGEWMRRIVI